MKKAMMLLLAVAVVLASLVLGGCGGGDKKDAGKAAQPAKEESVADLLAKGKKVTGLSYDFVMTTKNGQMTGKMWFQGKKMRSEMTMQNQKMVSIIDGDANVAYSYMPEQGVAMKVSLDAAEPLQTPDNYTKDLDAAKAKVVETTTYDGVRCKVLLVQNADDKSETKIWLREDYGIPARVEINDPSLGKMVAEYKNLKAGPIPADTFQLPAGVKITDMSGLTKQIPQKP